MKWSSLFFLLLLFTKTAKSQDQLVVLTKDSLSRKAIPSTTIKFIQQGKVLFTKQSDDNGKLTIPVPSKGEYLLEASFIGYKKLDTVLSFPHASTQIDLFLAPDIGELKAVNITASKPYLQMKKGNLILNVDQSPLMNAGSIWDMLRFAPSVQADESGGITVKNQNATIYIDGRRIYLTGSELKDYLASIPAANLEQVEIMGNPNASYPSDIQTVISIKTKSLKYEGVKGMLSYQATQATFLRHNVSTRLDIRKSIFDSQIGYTFQRGKLRGLSDYNTLYENTHPWDVHQRSDKMSNGNRVFANIGLKPKQNSQFTLYAEINPNSQDNATYSDNGPASPDRLQQGDSVFNFRSQSSSKMHTFFTQASYQQDWDSTRQSIKVQAEYFNNDRDYHNHREVSSIGRGADWQQQGYLDILPQGLRTFIGSLNYTRPLFKGELIAGLRFSHNRLSNQNDIFPLMGSATAEGALSSSRFRYTEKAYSAFTEWSKESGNLYYRLGLRLEKNRIHAKELTSESENQIDWLNLFPSALIQWAAAEHSVWSLSYKSNLTRPDYYQLNPFERFSDNSIANFKGNQAIKPQRNHTLDLSWTDNRLFTGSVGTQYLKDFISTIMLKDEQNNLYQQYDNFDAYLYYANLNLTVDPSKWWKIIASSNVMYADAHYSKVEKASASPMVELKMLQAFLLKKNWIAQIGVNYINTMDDGFFRHYQNSNISLALQKKFTKPNLTATLSANDLFKKEITAERVLYNNLFYRSSNYNDIRSVRISLLWNFGKQSVKVKEKNESESQEAIDRLK